MNIKKILQEEDAVSPVIGVILMVAITVILAAVIASFVLGLGPNTATTPTATFSVENTTDADGDYVLNVTMESGENLDRDALSFTGDINGDGVDADSNGVLDDSSVPSEITAGETISVGISNPSDYEISLVYEEGDTSSTMRTFEG